MVIGFDGSRAFVSHKTGTENYSYQLLRHLASIDHLNQYIVYLRPGTEVESSDWPDNFQFSILNFQFLWTQLGLAIETFKSRLDVLLVTAHTLPLLHAPGLKTVMTVHDLGAEYLPGMHQLKQRLYLGFITRFQLRSATKLIAVSEATRQDLITKIKIQSDKVEVIYEGLSLEKSSKSDSLDSILKHYEIEKNSYFLFVGTIQPRKNLERLIRAYSQFLNKTNVIPAQAGIHVSKKVNWIPDQVGDDKPKLILAGSRGWLSDNIYKLPAELGIDGSVKFLGRVEDKDLAALYHGAISLVFPSLFEGFGLPILEAFSNGCPVLTSNISAMPEVAGESAVYVDPYSVESITQGLVRIKDPKVRDKLIKSGRQQLKKFSWEKAARETLELIEKLQ